MVRNGLTTLALASVLVLAGCGGDGSSLNSGALTNSNSMGNNVPKAPDSGDLGLFVTGNPTEKNEHAWVLIKKVDLKLAAGGTRTIFEDAQGVGIDLASLRDNSGPKYRFINQLTLPAGTYTGAEITLGKSAVLFAPKASTGKSTDFDETLSLQFDPPKMLGTGHDDLVLDFALSQPKDSSKLGAVVTSSLGAGLEDADRNTAVVQAGTIENLKGEVPSQTFSLKSGKSADIVVATTTATTLLAEAETQTLAKGLAVEVSGSFDANTRRIDATSIRIKDPKAAAQAQLVGVISSFDPKASTWNETPTQTRGWLPESLSIEVSAASPSKYFDGAGREVSKDDFFKALADNRAVHVLAQGSYDPAKGRFLASEVRVLDVDAERKVDVSGVVVNPQSAGQMFSVTVASFHGMLSRAGATSIVAVTPSTVFADESGKTLSGDEFFAALATPKTATVEGILDTSTGSVMASSVKLSPAKSEKKPAAKRK